VQVPNALLSAALSQHPPLHSWVAEQAVVHWCVVVSQASPCAQSPATLHPQWPVAVMQAPPPPSTATQLVHIVPTTPHALAVSGEAQVVPLQQVPLHASVAEQALEHVCVVVLHACPEGQPLGPVQPASAASGPPSVLVSGWFGFASVASSPASTPPSLASGGTVESVPVSDTGPSVGTDVSAPPSSGGVPPSMSDRSKLTMSSQPIVVHAMSVTSVANTREARFRIFIPTLHACGASRRRS
jgi:hypothetical protein